MRKLHWLPAFRLVILAVALVLAAVGVARVSEPAIRTEKLADHDGKTAGLPLVRDVWFAYEADGQH